MDLEAEGAPTTRSVCFLLGQGKMDLGQVDVYSIFRSYLLLHSGQEKIFGGSLIDQSGLKEERECGDRIGTPLPDFEQIFDGSERIIFFYISYSHIYYIRGGSRQELYQSRSICIPRPSLLTLIIYWNKTTGSKYLSSVISYRVPII